MRILILIVALFLFTGSAEAQCKSAGKARGAVFAQRTTVTRVTQTSSVTSMQFGSQRQGLFSGKLRGRLKGIFHR